MSPTWATADLSITVPGDQPVSLRYLDSCSVPPASDAQRTTVIALHGGGFNSKIWLPWVDHLGPHIRLLAINRSGYEGSGRPPTGGNAIVHPFRSEIMDLLAFMKYAVDKLGVTAHSDNGRSDIVFLGWSKGCAQLMALLSLLPTLFGHLAESTTTLKFDIPVSSVKPYIPYLRSHLSGIILYEPPANAIGVAQPSSGMEGMGPDVLGKFLTGWLKTTVPEAMRAPLDEAEESHMMIPDLKYCPGGSPEECRDIAEEAFREVPKEVKLALLYCEKTVVSCVETAEWIANRLNGQTNTTTAMIEGGSHFYMATNPAEWNAEIEGLLSRM